MTGSTWALPQQTAFLSERMHLYQKHQAAQTLGSSFWPLVHSAFFLVWPTQESEIAQEKANKENPSQIRGASKSNLKAASKSKTASGLSVEGTAKKSKERTMYATHEAWVKARKGQIKSWYGNNTRTTGERKQKVEFVLAAPVVPRKLTEVQTYSTLFYSTRIKPHFETHMAQNPGDTTPPVTIRARLAKELYQEEEEWVKKDVCDEMAKAEAKRRETKEVMGALTSGEPVDSASMGPRDYAKGVHVIPEVAKAFLSSLAGVTGWSWTLIGGGPDPDKENGGIRTTAHHIGINGLNQCFDEAHPRFLDIVQLFKIFCHSVYPEEERIRRAFSVSSAKAVDKGAVAESGRLDGVMQFQAVQKPKESASVDDACRLDEANGSGAGSGASVNDARRFDGANGSGAGSGASVNDARRFDGANGLGAGSGASVNDARRFDGANGSGAGSGMLVEGCAAGEIDKSSYGGKGGVGYPGVFGEWGRSAPSVLGHDIPGGTDAGRENGIGSNEIGEDGLEVIDDGLPLYHEEPGAAEFGAGGATGLLDVGKSQLLPTYPIQPATEDSRIQHDLRILHAESELALARKAAEDAEFQAALRGRGVWETMRTNTDNMGAFSNTDFLQGGSGPRSTLYSSFGMNSFVVPPADPNAMASLQGTVFQFPPPPEKSVEPSPSGKPSPTREPSHPAPSREPSPTREPSHPAPSREPSPTREPSHPAPSREPSPTRKPSPIHPEPKKKATGKRKLVEAPVVMNTEPRGKRARKVTRVIPKWVEEARAYLAAASPALEWGELVLRWYQIECLSASDDTGSRLGGATARPVELSKWFGSKHKGYDGQSMPTISDADTFSKGWIQWWNAMQPKIRRSDDGGMPLPLTAEMTGAMKILLKTGASGLVVLLIGLRWWAPRGAARRKLWMDAVNDVNQCLKLFAGVSD